jgi:DNA-binding response OmpR family regulator
VTDVAPDGGRGVQPEVQVTRSGKTVLIVDDDRPSRAVLSIVCGARGHAVIEVTCGADAIAAVTTRRPDLILLDVSLPDMSGLEVCARVRGAGIRTPILMLSGHADPADVARGLWLGADVYLTKPYDLRQLMARIDEHLRGPSSRAA